MVGDAQVPQLAGESYKMGDKIGSMDPAVNKDCPIDVGVTGGRVDGRLSTC